MKECLSAVRLAGAMDEMKAGKTDYSSAQCSVFERDYKMVTMLGC